MKLGVGFRLVIAKVLDFLYQYFYQTYIIQKDNNMRNYLDLDTQAYSRPARSSAKKYTMNANLGVAQGPTNNKSTKKITYVLSPDADERYNKENTLQSCRSNVNIELPPEKTTKTKKRSSSFLNKSSSAYSSKNQNYLAAEKSKARSRWELTHYPQNYNYDAGPSEFIHSEVNGDMKNNALNFKSGMQTYFEYNKLDTNTESYQSYADKKNTLGYDTGTNDNYPKFGIQSKYKPQKTLTYSKSSKNIPFYEKLKSYNQPSFRTGDEQSMHNTYSHSDYKNPNENLPSGPSKPMNQSVGGYKYKQIIDSYEFKNLENPYGISRVKSNFPPLPSKIKQESLKEPELDDFLIGQCKGEGRFGKVYMAIHKRTGLLCALKKIKKQSVKYMIDQFIQEIKIQLYLNHPKLVKVYGYFADAEHFYMLVEYMEEGCLYSIMKKNKKFEEQEAAEKLNEICDGIKQMHDHNIVHRDLKPENIVLSHGVCKICDFGWAAICQDRRQTYCGTLDYVCPEIVEGNAYDSSADIWCIGVLAYEMMCGKAPFYDISRQKTIQKIKSCKIDSFPSHLSKKAIKFIQMILKKNPEFRVGIQQLLDSDFLKSARK